MSFSVAIERKLDPRASLIMGSSFVGNSPHPLVRQVNRIMVLWQRVMVEGGARGRRGAFMGESAAAAAVNP